MYHYVCKAYDIPDAVHNYACVYTIARVGQQWHSQTW